MARTDATSVQAILLKDYDAENAPSLTPFITWANLLLNRVVTCATAKGITFSDDELLALETWLAAHAYTANDPQYTSKSTAGASGSFAGAFDKGLNSSRYGQMALSLDPSGCLDAITNRKRARAFWLGKAPSEQIDYDQRD